MRRIIFSFCILLALTIALASFKIAGSNIHLVGNNCFFYTHNFHTLWGPEGGDFAGKLKGQLTQGSYKYDAAQNGFATLTCKAKNVTVYSNHAEIITSNDGLPGACFIQDVTPTASYNWRVVVGANGDACALCLWLPKKCHNKDKDDKDDDDDHDDHD